MMSLTIVSLAVGIVLMVAQYAGVSLTEGELHDWLATSGKLLQVIGTLAALLGAWWGRVRRGDITWYGKRK